MQADPPQARSGAVHKLVLKLIVHQPHLLDDGTRCKPLGLLGRQRVLRNSHGNSPFAHIPDNLPRACHMWPGKT